MQLLGLPLMCVVLCDWNGLDFDFGFFSCHLLFDCGCDRDLDHRIFCGVDVLGLGSGVDHECCHKPS